MLNVRTRFYKLQKSRDVSIYKKFWPNKNYRINTVITLMVQTIVKLYKQGGRA